MAALAGLALATWESGQSRSSQGAHWSVALLVVVALATALALGRHRQYETSPTWLTHIPHSIRHWRTQPPPAVIATVVWTVLIAAVIGWDVVSFIYQAHDLPTLSYFIGHVTRYRVGRGACFALWLALGAYLAAGWRTETRP